MSKTQITQPVAAESPLAISRTPAHKKARRLVRRYLKVALVATRENDEDATAAQAELEQLEQEIEDALNLLPWHGGSDDAADESDDEPEVSEDEQIEREVRETERKIEQPKRRTRKQAA